MDESTRKWKEKIAKAEARLAESVEDLEAAEKRIESADEKCKNLKKELEAARASQKEDVDAASRRESQNSLKEEELKSLLDKQAKEIEALNKQLNQLKENKDANLQAGDPSSNLKEQFQDLKAHHNTAVDLFKGEIDSLRNKLESTSSQTRNLEVETGRLRKELEEKVREQKELEEKHNELHNSYRDLQKELSGNKQNEGMLPQGLGLAGGGSGSSSSYPAPSPLLSPGLSRDDAVRINQGKLEAENSQLRARCEELSLQNDRMRDAVGIMRLEMESLQRRTRTPSLSPIKKHAGVKHLKEEVNYLKSQVQDMADELGELRAGSPNVHCRRPPRRQSTSPTRSGVSPERRPKSSAKMQSSSHSRSSRSPPHVVRSPSSDSPRGGGIGDRVSEVDLVNLSLRAQLKAAKTDMARIIKERDLLMELSNALRADLSKIVQSGAGEYAQNPYFGYSAVPPSLTAQFQQEFESGTIPQNAKLMTGVNSSHDIAHAARPRTVSPGKTRFRSDTKATEPRSKSWGFGVGHGETREKPEVMELQLEGKSYLHERPQGLDNDPLHKGTNSQRARLKAAMKRKEELSRPKARNWNIKDDHPLEA